MAFNFREFFRTWTGDPSQDFRPLPTGAKVGDFVHEDDVKSFLNLITSDDAGGQYPFSTHEFRQMFTHTFWMVPGVKAAAALSELLCRHPVFMHYKIANVEKALGGNFMSKKRKKQQPHLWNPETAGFTDYSDPKTLESMTKYFFSRSRERFKGIAAEHPAAAGKMDLDADRSRRRIAAVCHYAPRVRELVQDVCPDIPEAGCFL